MTQQKYATKDYNPEHMARALGRALPISTKTSVEICMQLKNKKVQRAKDILNDVIEKKAAMPFKRYNRSIGHKPGKMSVGRYPLKASKEILLMIESVEANAQFKGLNTANLVISHICAQKAGKQMHHGRQRGRIMKRTHIEIIVEERAEKKKEAPKKEAKPEEKKVEPKLEKPVENKPEVKEEAKPAEKQKAEEKPKQEESKK